MLKVNLTNENGTVDITKLCTTKTISGDYNRCVRSLDFGILSNPYRTDIPIVKVSLGDVVTAVYDGEVLFSGVIFVMDKITDSSEIKVTCFDRGIYLKRNDASYDFKKATPEGATQRICSDFGIPVGNLASTGIILNRKFLGVSLVDIITTMYTLASQENGKKYVLRFIGDSLDVVERGDNSILNIDGKTNLMQASVDESIENVINQVVIQDEKGKIINTINDEESVKLYGLMQSVIKKGKEDASNKAKKILTDNRPTQKIAVQNLGSSKCITGNAVTIKETYTGLVGLFQIDSDTHTWKNGQYFNKLVLNFEKIMGEKTSGTGDE